MGEGDKALVWLHGVVRTPPLSQQARLHAGSLLRLLQSGEGLSLPFSRPMPVMGSRCHELRIDDAGISWRIVYRVDQDAIVIVDVFKKKTQRAPAHVIEACKRRLASYDTE
jgi:phage-related protein